MADRRLIRLASDPVRLRVLTFLNDRAAGAGEVAATLDISVADAGRHLNALHDDELIEVVGEVLNRGTVEPRYRALVHSIFDEEEWAMFSLDEKKRLTGWILDMIEADSREALAQGTFTARDDAHASRTVSTVDEQGWIELRRIHDEALFAVLAVEAAAAERLAERGEDGFPALSAMLCCELPQRS
jgi:DNA-binding transcriptional ArsR family regulator